MLSINCINPIVNYYIINILYGTKFYYDKFYSLAILCRERKLMDFSFTELWLIKLSHLMTITFYRIEFYSYGTNCKI